jgi:hypothetical protein
MCAALLLRALPARMAIRPLACTHCAAALFVLALYRWRICLFIAASLKTRWHQPTWREKAW